MTPLEIADLPGLFVGFFLTIMVFSYLFGDNVLYRLAVHVFIGVAAAYATMVVVYNIIWYQLLVPLLLSPLEQIFIVAPPLLLGIWLFTRTSRGLARYSTPVLALMAGIGAAAAVGGAVKGTLFPQINASIGMLDLDTLQPQENVLFWFFNSLVVLGGTVTTLVYFHFGIRSKPGGTAGQRAWIEIPSMIGQGFIAVTFGALFAGVYAAALAAFIERALFLWNFFWSLLSRFIEV
jgi:hypothetical protein